jgi:hypothetical protein
MCHTWCNGENNAVVRDVPIKLLREEMEPSKEGEKKEKATASGRTTSS